MKSNWLAVLVVATLTLLPWIDAANVLQAMPAARVTQMDGTLGVRG